MIQDNKILVGVGENPVYMLADKANRHGLIAGATGTGKTSTLKVMAEGLSDLGVPVFLADIKGDVNSIGLPGEKNDKIKARLEKMGLAEDAFDPKAYPCRFWDVYGEDGIPVRAKVSSMGPVLLARLLGLTDVQEGVLNIAFHLADDKGWELLDFKDLRAMLTYVADHKDEVVTTYGNVTSQSVGAIQRALLTLEDEGAEKFFGEPEMDIANWFQVSEDGRGYVNLLHCVKLAQHPLLYGMFMLWMLSDLYERLPEVGDLDKPKLVFFFDEAHMLFDDAPKALVEKVTQVVKLVRSKGVGVFFISQSPSDIPDSILSQLNNKILHGLHAYTPADQKAVKAAAQGLRPNPAFKTEEVIANLGTGEALISMLDENGAPGITEKVLICPPESSFTPLAEAAKAMLITKDPCYETYKDAVDNQSAYEYITEEKEEADQAAAEAQAQKEAEEAEIAAQKEAEKQAKEEEKAAKAAARQASLEEKQAAQLAAQQEKARQAQYKAEGRDKYGRTKVQASVEKAVKSAAKSEARVIGRNVGKSITRGVLGTSNNTANRVAGNVAGSLFSDLIGGLFKR